MRFFAENIDRLRELYINQLKLVLSAEKQVGRILLTMANDSTDADLKHALGVQQEEASLHVTRLKELLNQPTRTSRTVKSEALSALMVEAEDMIRDTTDESVRDVAIILAALRIKHYKLAVYGSVHNFAQVLGETREAELIATSLKDDHRAIEKLEEIAARITSSARSAA